MRQFFVKHKKRIVVWLALLLLAFPMRADCGRIGYACATAPDDNGYYYTHFDIQPFAVTLLEAIVQTDLPFRYASIEEAHYIGAP